MIAAMSAPAAAEVLDAVYRGTLVCDKLPFTRMPRCARPSTVTIVGRRGALQSCRAAARQGVRESVWSRAPASLNGQNIDLQGSWKDGTRQYEAKYSGTFVRRSAQLKGTQTWTEGGKTMTRACSGAIKRPLKPFLPRNKPAAA